MAGYHRDVSPSTLDAQRRARRRASPSPSPARPRTLNAYAGGQLTWTDGTHVVRIPLVVRPVALAAPPQVSDGGRSLQRDVRLRRALHGHGPRARPGGHHAGHGRGRSDRQHLLAGLAQCPAGPGHGAGRHHLRAVLAVRRRREHRSATSTCACSTGTTLVGSSGCGTSAEEVNLVNPAAGDYTVVVQGWGSTGSSPFKLHTWLLGTTAAGQHDRHRPGDRDARRARQPQPDFSGLTAGTKYLGSVAYGGVGRDAEPDDRPRRSLALPAPAASPQAPRTQGPRHAGGLAVPGLDPARHPPGPAVAAR